MLTVEWQLETLGSVLIAEGKGFVLALMVLVGGASQVVLVSSAEWALVSQPMLACRLQEGYLSPSITSLSNP
jgi:hypothetical protein